MKPFFRSVLLLAPLNAVAQMESGTLIVLNTSQDEIVVAADSRSYSVVAQFDNRCKITALGNQLIFAASGNTGYGPNDGRPLEWDSHTIARAVFLRLSRETATQPMPIGFAEAWGNEVKNKFQGDIERDGLEGVLFGAEGDTLTSAVFAGFDGDAPLIVTASITYSISAKGHADVAFAITDVFRRPKAVFMGRQDIADELFTGKTPRSLQWRQDLAMMRTPGDDPIALPALEALRFSIEHYPLVNIGGKMLPPIGGPIDAVRLSRANGIEWIQRKDNCRETDN